MSASMLQDIVRPHQRQLYHAFLHADEGTVDRDTIMNKVHEEHVGSLSSVAVVK